MKRKFIQIHKVRRGRKGVGVLVVVLFSLYLCVSLHLLEAEAVHKGRSVVRVLEFLATLDGFVHGEDVPKRFDVPDKVQLAICRLHVLN